MNRTDHTYTQTDILKVNVWVISRFNAIVRLDDLLDSTGDEVVEGINVLLDQASDLEERGEERELVDGVGERRGQRTVGRLLRLQLLHGRVVVT